MKYLGYILGLIMIIVLMFLSKICDFEVLAREFKDIFLLLLIVLLTFIVAFSYQSYLSIRGIDHLYFSISYFLILLITIFLAQKDLTYKIFNDYYFYTVKYLEVTVYFFGIFIINERLKVKKFILDVFIFIVVNFILFLLAVKYRINGVFIIALYIEIIYLYSKVKKTDIRNFLMKIIKYKVLSEIFNLTNGLGVEYIYIISYYFYLYSIIEVIIYFNYNLRKYYFSQNFNRNKKINKLINVYNEGVIITSNYFIKKVNKEALNILGYKRISDLRGKNLFSVLEGVNKAQIKDLLELYPKEDELLVKKYNEKSKKIKALAYSIKGELGEEIVLVIKRLTSIPEIFYNISDDSPALTYIYERGFGYRYISKSVKDLLAYSPKEFYKKPDLINELVYKDPEDFSTHNFDLKEGSFERKYLNKNGEIKHIIETVSKINIGNKDLFYCIGNDITELKNKSSDLGIENEELKSSNIKKEMTMSIVSHEIRTPITAIIGFLENILINKSSVEKRILNMVYKIYSNSMRLKEIVNNLLDLNKLNAGKLEIYNEKIDLKSTIDEVIINNEMLMEIKEITCENNVASNIEIYLDSSMFYQIINNLVSNGIKYNKKQGKIMVDYELAGNRVIIKITDTGLGISSENSDKVFKEYERVKGSKEKGTGLGLPLTKKLVELNNGEIWFVSELGKGTTFYLTLPLYQN